MRRPGGGQQAGVTLLELVVVVAIIGILAALALYLFTRQTRKAKASEVNAIFGEMKVREQAFYLENDTFLPTGASDSDTFPTTTAPAGTSQSYDLTASSAPPDPWATKWPDPAWKTLRIDPDHSELYCVYVAIAGDGGDDTNAGPKALEAPFSLGSADNPIPATDWYYLMAECDFDGDGTPSRYFTLADSTKIVIENSGE